MKINNKFDSLAADVHRDAKFFRWIGCLILAVALLSVFFLARADDLSWNILTAFLLMLVCLGLAMLFLGDRLIRKIKKHTGVDVGNV